jgi:putative membrane protein
MKQYFILFFKGLGMGAANVIPGVSGGTIALITGIFERLINAIKAFNLTALKLLLKGKLKELAKHLDLYFLGAVFLGIGISILSIARLFEFLFDYYPVLIWAYFFGLILGSVYFVGKTIDRYTLSVMLVFIVGAGIALSITFLNPARENESLVYLFLCGIIAACSMILPGLSGSFVLMLLGNYELVMIDAVNQLNLMILLPVVAGAGVGLIAFSWFLSWIFRKFRNHTIAVLTGFILGSLGIIWPWKKSWDLSGNLLEDNQFGAFTGPNGSILESVKISAYEQVLPSLGENAILIATVLILAGIFSVWGLEKLAEKKSA